MNCFGKPSFSNKPEQEKKQEKDPYECSVEELLTEQDLQSQDVLEEIFKRGNDEQLERLRKKTSLSEKEIEISQHYAKLREEVIDDMKEKTQERKEISPQASKEEMALGAYKEAIEPHVEDAVFTLREKGYGTVSSGFAGPGAQQIIFKDNDYLDKLDNKEELKEKIAEKGAELNFEPDTVFFICKKKMDLEELEEIWNEITDALPDLEQEAPQTDHPQARRFRKKQEELKS